MQRYKSTPEIIDQAVEVHLRLSEPLERIANRLDGQRAGPTHQVRDRQPITAKPFRGTEQRVGKHRCFVDVD
jgi:hypothetical protein